MKLRSALAKYERVGYMFYLKQIQTELSSGNSSMCSTYFSSLCQDISINSKSDCAKMTFGVRDYSLRVDIGSVVCLM